MNTTIKNYLGITIIGVLIVAIVLGVLGVIAYRNSKSAEFSNYRSFTVTSDGRAIALPDIAEFSFSIITEGGKNIADLQRTNTDKTNKAIEFLKSNGIETRDIKTQNYNIEPRYNYFPCPPYTSAGICRPAEITGYSVSQSIHVKMRDFSKIGILLTGVVSNGANSVSALTFTIDDPAKVQNKARAEAIARAKKKAESTAEAGGFSLGNLLSIEEGGVYAPTAYRSLYSKEAAGYGGDIALPAPVVEPGSQEVVVNVVLRYEIDY